MEQLDSLKEFFDSGATKSIQWRLSQLQCLATFLTECESGILGVLERDFKSHYDALGELRTVQSATVQAIENLGAWVSPEYLPRSLAFYTDSCSLRWEPRGVALIIAPWNYPLSLLIEPLIGAISAGCVAVLKPSEITKHTAEFIASHLPKFVKDAVVINGGAEITQQLLDWPRWGLIFYTGNNRVGKIVQEKASRHLIPTVLELGGKCPCVVLGGDLEVVAKRIIFGKLFNCGQTCVAPDYVLASDVEGLYEQITKVIASFYGSDPCESSDLSSIVNEHHWDRLDGLLAGIDKSKITRFGVSDRSKRRFAPTIVIDPPLGSRLMVEEIFGPILPIIKIDSIEEAVKFVKSRDTPLAAYLFSPCQDTIEYFQDHIQAGGMTINDTMMHIFSGLLPLAAIGASGSGRYKGRWSFETFSYAKPIMWRSLRGEILNDWTRNPPLNEKKFSLTEKALFTPIKPRHCNKNGHE